MALTAKKRIRRDYAPLNVVVTVVNDTPNSPLVQVYDGDSGTYEPNRAVTPLLLRPNVYANVSDGSLSGPLNNSNLSTGFTWYLNGKTLAYWAGQSTDTMMQSLAANASVDTSSSATRGSITINTNITIAKKVELIFEGTINDPRTATNYTFRSEPVILSTVDKSDDGHSIELSDSNRQLYNPLNDTLTLHDYKQSREMYASTNEADIAKKAALADINSYLRTINFKVMSGKSAAPSAKYVVELHKVTASGIGEQLTTDNCDELVSLSNTSVTLDLRLVDYAQYAIVAYKTDYVETDGSTKRKLVAMETFAVQRHLELFNPDLLNECDVNAEATVHTNEVVIASRGDVVKYPGAYFTTQWKAQTASYSDGGSLKKYAEGPRVEMQLNELGVLTTSGKDWLEVAAEVDYNEVAKLAADASGNVYTDADGNPYIFR